MDSDPSEEAALSLTPARVLDYRYRGVVIGLMVIACWAVVLYAALWRLPATGHAMVRGLVLVPLETFLYVGLFITAHDAMHGTLAPGHPRLNHFLGGFALLLYAGFRYSRFREAHHRHHRHPGTAQDPDFATGGDERFLPWFAGFMRGYLSWRQLAVTAAIGGLLLPALGVPLVKMLVFWALPVVLSAIQLFYFGTYLPHRTAPDGHRNRHRARSSGYPVVLSFVTCFHFGYHLEHHIWPFIPWWRLPSARDALPAAPE